MQDLEHFNIHRDAAPRYKAGHYRPGVQRLTVRGAAAYLGVSEPALRDRMRRGTGPKVYMHNTQFAVDIGDLQAYAASRGEGPKE